MKNINIVSLSGRLTKGSELWEAKHSNTMIIRFDLAFNTSRKNEKGEWCDESNFIRCIGFGSRAESWHNMLNEGKGFKVHLQGSLSHNQWTDDEGKKHSYIQVIVDTLEVDRSHIKKEVTAGSTSRFKEQYSNYKTGNNSTVNQTPASPSHDFNDDIPF